MHREGTLLTATVVRTQHAVGHGGFHTGNIRLCEDAPVPNVSRNLMDIWYVYDCGSEQSTALRDALAWYRRASHGCTDILFVSHIHADHINGIEKLQGMAPTKTVVIPYLDLIERILILLSAFETGSISSSNLEYFRNPVEWWKRRGVKRIVMIQAGRGRAGEPPAFPEKPDSPIDGHELEEIRLLREQKEPAGKLAARFKRPFGRVPKGLTPADERSIELGEAAILAGSGSSFQMEWSSDIGELVRTGNWILLPYVHPVEVINRKAFSRDLKKVLQINDSNEETIFTCILQHLASHEKTECLIDLYRHHFTGGHNAVSMSLYSGPHCLHARGSKRTRWQFSLERKHFDMAFHVTQKLRNKCRVGWIAAGDAELREERRRKPWLDFFAQLSEQMCVITLPHHGSARNYHDDIVQFANFVWALATTIEKRSRVARLRETLASVEACGVNPWIVGRSHDQAFSVECSCQLWA